MATPFRVRVTHGALRAVVYLGLVLAGTVLAEVASAADIGERSPRVLVLYPYDERLPATNIGGEAARARLLQFFRGNIDLFSEFLDLSRSFSDVLGRSPIPAPSRADARDVP